MRKETYYQNPLQQERLMYENTFWWIPDIFGKINTQINKIKIEWVKDSIYKSLWINSDISKNNKNKNIAKWSIDEFFFDFIDILIAAYNDWEIGKTIIVAIENFKIDDFLNTFKKWFANIKWLDSTKPKEVYNAGKSLVFIFMAFTWITTILKTSSKIILKKSMLKKISQAEIFALANGVNWITQETIENKIESKI